ncbi:MAG TPA: mersacidin/lichenicidin family type 2 lantibiotic [Ktedonosporobacter sp.]|nr:mersacidin/lichenicidin family type 2 lantibiotic [Ktedonosporobacter sp.]
MSVDHIINAWRDEEYRESLDFEQRASLLESPIGAIDLSEEELIEIQGGGSSSSSSDVTFGPFCVAFAVGTLILISAAVVSAAACN